MEKEARFRILNKTNKTVTLKIDGKPVTSTWEEFNESFVVVDKFWAVFNDEMKKKQEEIDDLLGFITVYVLEMNVAKRNNDASKELSAAGMVGSLINKLQNISGFTTIQIIQLVQKRLMALNPFMANPMFPMDKKQKSIRHHNQAEIRKEQENKATPVVVENKPTLGDAFSCLGELKDKMEKGE